MSVESPVGIESTQRAENGASLTAADGLRRSTIAPHYGRRDYLVRRVLALSDLVALGAAISIAVTLSPTRPGSSQLFLALLALPLWIALFRAYGLYESDVKRMNHTALDDVPKLFHALLVGTLLLWIYFRIIPDETERLVLFEVAVFGAVAVPGILGLRSLARRMIRRLMGPERIAFLGEASALPALVRKIAAHPEYGLESVGIIAHRDHSSSRAELPVLAVLEEMQLAEVVRRHAIERMIVAHSEVDDDSLLQLLQECGRLSVKVSILPRYVDALGPSTEVDEIEGVTVLDLNPLVLPRSSRWLKRSLDAVGAGMGLVLSAPLLALTAIAILVDSGRPVLFRQERVGRRGEAFSLLKFRTMVVGAEDQTRELFDVSEDPHWLKVRHDPRVTRVGRVLRSFSLDELPQLVNVLRGEMSLVGPRPLLRYQDAQLTDWTRTRVDLAPGITGVWQVLGRTNIPFEEMVKLDTLYVTNWSLWLDIKLLLRTVRTVLTRQGAN